MRTNTRTRTWNKFGRPGLRHPEPEPVVQEQGQCVHHWVIEPPSGPVSKGVCKICGTEKEFKNHVFYSDWVSEDKGTVVDVGTPEGDAVYGED